MSRSRRRAAEDARDLLLRLESDGLHDGDVADPALLLPFKSVDAHRATLERIVACVNACRGIATENLPIVAALDDAERALINERTIPRWDQEASYINRGFAEEITMRRARREADKPTIDEKLDRILALLEKGHR